MSSPGTGRLAALSTSPAAPAPGYLLLYFKTDGFLYIKDSSNVETPLGSSSAITSIVGEATASGPGVASITLSNSAVIGKVLTGFTPGPNTTVLASDTILQAIQKLQAQTSAISGTSLLGDVTGTLAATVVSFVGGKTSTDVAQSVQDTQDATALATAQRIVKRDVNGDIAIRDLTVRDVNASGDVSATGTVTGSNLSGTNTGDVTVTDTDTVDLTLTGQDIQADVRISDSTITSDVNGIKVGTVPVAQISGFNEAAQDAVGSILTDTDTIDLTYNDAGNLITADVKLADATIISTPTGIKVGTLVPGDITGFNESAQDAVGSILTDTDTIDMTYDDVGNIITADVRISDGTLTSDAGGLKVGTIPTSQVTGFDEAAQDAVGSILTDTNSIDLTYNDAGNTISADIKISADAATAGYAKASTTIHTDGLHVEVQTDAPVQVGTSNFIGSGSNKVAQFDHVHAHGNQTSGTLHAAATTSVNGFMSAADKTKLDNATDANTPSTLVIRDASGDFAAGTITASLTGAASDNLLKAGDVMTGYFRTAVVALVDGPTINTDASLGNVFTVTIAGNRTFAAPSNPLADQKITYKIRQDAVGGRVITWDAAFNFGVDLSGVPNSTSPNVFDYYGFQYDSTTSSWHCLALSRGY